MKQPTYSIFIDNKDITANFSPRLISMDITDNLGLDADTITLVLDDSDGTLEIPKQGVNITVCLGWTDSDVTLQNLFTIKACTHSGTPDKLTLNGTSAEFRESLNDKQDQSYSMCTLGDIVAQIAKRHDLTYRIDEQLSAMKIDHIDQTKESDKSFLTHLTDNYNAICSLKNGILMVFKRGAGVTVSGQPIPTAIITRQSGDSHSFTASDREQYTSVKAYWLDYTSPETQQTTVQSVIYTDSSDGTKHNLKTLRHTYSSYSEAYFAAQNEWQKQQQNGCKFKLKLAEGRPDLYPETPVHVIGFKNQIDSTSWIIKSCQHHLDANGGFTTNVDLEIKLDDDKQPVEK